MTPEARRKYFNLCDPNAPLEPEDPRAFDIDLFGTDEGPVRGAPWVEDLVRDLTLSDAPRCDLFTGLPGSGKSTLLRRLKRELESPQDAGAARFLCVLVNAEQWVDPSAKIDVPDILLAVVYEVERAVLTAEGGNADDAAVDGAVSRLWNWLSKTNVELKEIEATLDAEAEVPGFTKVSAGTKAVIELKTNPTLRQRVRAAVQERMHVFLEQVRGYLRELHRRTVALKYEGIVVIVDSLEKLRGIADTFDEVLKSAEEIFAGGAPYLHLADPDLGDKAPKIHALYTVPPALVLRRAIHDLRFLPMIKLHDQRSGADYAPGYMAARELIRRRIPDADLSDVFGPASLEDRCRELITWSGGYPREIVRLLRECVKQSVTVDKKLFQRLLSTAADAYRRTVTVDMLPWLASVCRHHDLQQSEEPRHRQLIARALSDNLVLRYKNGEEWFNVHPALTTMPALVEACEALEREAPPRARADG